MAIHVCRRVLVSLAMLVVAAASPAAATTVIPVPEDALVEHAVLILTGRVERIESHWTARRDRIVTDITLSVDEVLKGQIAVSELTVRQTGGRVRDVQSWIDGSPEFHVGERVLVFLRQNADGTLRVAHLFQGKLSIRRDPITGADYAHRDASPAGVHVLGGAGAPVRTPLDDVRARIRARVASSPRGRSSGVPIVTEAAPAADGVVEAQASFTYLGSPSRWFEPDAGQAIAIRADARGELAAPGGGFDQLRAAYDAWSSVPASSLRMVDGGSGSTGGYVRDGVNSITFDDPNGEIDPPVRCSGTLAFGGYFRTNEAKVVNGQSFFRIVEGDVVLADGWQGCNFYESFANLAEVVTHELGHVLGLGHANDPDSIMWASAHFDGRGARLAADDVAAIAFMYPGTGPVAPTGFPLTVVRSGAGTGTVVSSPSGIACGSDCSETFASGATVTLTATAAGGSTFVGWSGGGCSGSGATCQVTMLAATTVTATFGTAAPTSITVTGPNGGETWAPGSTQRITWTYTGNPGATVRIVLLKAGVFSRTIASSAPVGAGAAGSLDWVVPAGQAPGADYKVRVISTANGAYRDTSDRPFTIGGAGSATGITVLSANGGEVWTAGSAQTIRWSYGGAPGDTVKITLLKGGAWNRLITSSAAIGSGGAGSFTWTVPPTQTPGSDYTIKIISTSSTTYQDTSDAPFSVTSP